jgi:hypothetical protein
MRLRTRAAAISATAIAILLSAAAVASATIGSWTSADKSTAQRPAAAAATNPPCTNDDV